VTLRLILSTDTYTEVELKRASLWCLTDFKGKRNIFIGLRDRAMMLFSASMAVRGESARILLWSDLFVSEIPMDDVRQGLKIPVSAISFLLAIRLTTIITDCNFAAGPRDSGR
jgi:hypothetical protein